MTGTIKTIDDARGFGIILGRDGNRVPFLLVDIQYRVPVVVGERVVFSVRKVQGNTFAENISHEAVRKSSL
jgi:cold shock CspA family protein